VLHNELTKHVFWKLGIVTELLTGRDGLTRAAIVKMVNCDKTSCLWRSIKHLIPSVNIESNEETAATPQPDQTNEETTPQSTDSERPPQRERTTTKT